jgi:hypothetical protein
MVRLSYRITNNSDKEYPFVTLQTRLNGENINFIHNVQGTFSLTEAHNTVEIPNLPLHPHQSVSVSFEFRLNYTEGSDFSLRSQPRILSKDKQVLSDGQESALTVKPWKPLNVPALIKKITGQ